MKLLETLADLARAFWFRIRNHYHKEKVNHRKEDFYDDFASGPHTRARTGPPPQLRPAARWVSFVVLVAIVIAMGILFYRVMSAFFLPLFMALLLTVIFRPLHLRLVDRLGYRPIAAALTTLIVLTIVLAPLAWVATLAVKDGMQLIAGTEIDDVQKRLSRLRSAVGLEVPPMEEVNRVEEILLELLNAETTHTLESQAAKLTDARKHLQDFRAELSEGRMEQLEGLIVPLENRLQQTDGELVPDSTLQDALFYAEQLRPAIAGGPMRAWLVEQANPSAAQLREWRRHALDFAQENVVSATGATTEFVVKLIVGLLIMIVSLYFFLADGPALLEMVMNLSPLDEVYERELLLEFDSISRAVVLATLLSALVQALLAGIGYWAVGLNSVFLFMMLTFIMAMVPFVGAGSVWLPITLYIYFNDERTGAALFLLLYGMLVISLADNIVKPLVLHGQSNLHPLLALLSILGGVQALGPIGIFVGPMAVSFLQTLLNLLHREMMNLDAGKSATQETGANEPAS